MTEWLVLYALGFFFMAGQKSMVLMGLADGIIVTHNKFFLAISMLFDVLFWFVVLPLQLSKYWRDRSRDGAVSTGTVDLPFQPEMPEKQPTCPQCGGDLRCGPCDYLNEKGNSL